MKDRILDAVYRLVKIKGVNGFTMNDISKEIHIGKQTIYTYFKSKDQLMIEFIRTSLEDNKALTNSAVLEANGFKEKLGAAMHSYHRYKIPLEIFEEIKKMYPESWEILEEQRNFKLKIVMDILEEGIKSGEISKDANPQIVNYVLDKVTSALLNDEFLHKNNMTLNQALEELINLLSYGMIIR